MPKRRYIGLMMCLICLAMHSYAELATYMVDSYHSVVASGDLPPTSSSVYQQTNNRRSQLTAGTSATLTLSGYQGATLHVLTLVMHSNTASGAGGLAVTSGNRMIFSLSDQPFSAWTQSGYSTVYVPIELPIDRLISDDLTITISASANSLYIESFSLDYTPAVPQAYTITFHTYSYEELSALTEEYPDAGIVLPALTQPLCNGFLFLGWSPTWLLLSDERPNIFLPGSRYYPQANTTLHAVYTSNVSATSWLPDTTYADGDYLILSPYRRVQMAGPVLNGYIDALPITLATDNRTLLDAYAETDALYTLTFYTPDSTLTISHLATGTLVSPPATPSSRLTTAERCWQYRSQHDRLLIYASFSSDNMRNLGARRVAEIDSQILFQAVPCTPATAQDSSKYICLYAPPQTDEPAYYTSFPMLTDIPSLPTVIHIHQEGVANPEGRLLKLFTLQGQCLLSTHDDISFDCFPAGIYVLRGEKWVKKLIIH